MGTPHSARRQRSQHFFELYFLLGPDRSIDKLRQMLLHLGTNAARNTLVAYSRDFKWQERVRDLDSAQQAERDQTLQFETTRMDEDHARLGKAMQILGARKFDALGKQTPETLDVGDAIRMVRTGVDIERLAKGAPTERKELVAYVWNIAIKDIVTLFLEVNIIKDEKDRLIAWTEGADRIVESRMTSEIINQN
jgi:hypothetical protein